MKFIPGFKNGIHYSMPLSAKLKIATNILVERVIFFRKMNFKTLDRYPIGHYK